MTFQPNDITKQHVIQAISKINSENIKPSPSLRYDVIVDGKAYPPKEVLRYAHEELNGENRWDYNGGDPTNSYLVNMGFEIVEKHRTGDPIATIIAKYKAHLVETRLADEIYKWKLIKQFLGRPNVDADDFYEEIKSITYKNLIFPTAITVIRFIAQHRSEEYREAFRDLFNESTPLSDRMDQFVEKAQRLYREVETNPTLKLFHEERTLATILTFYDPAKYTMYKDSFYKKFCTLVGETPRKAGRKYVHYLELIDKFISEYVANDDELLSTVNEYLPDDCYRDPNHKILAQDILYQILDKATETSFWVFQSNPKVYDLERDLSEGRAVDEWTVSAHRDKIKVGDKIILWSTGKKAGCYALAEVTEEPQKIGDSTDSEDGNSFKAGIVVTHNLVDSPILQDRVRSISGLRDLKGGTQGTNFTATKQQYELIRNLIDDNYSDREDLAVNQPQTISAKNTILYGPPGTGKTYNSIDRAVEIVDGTCSRDHAVNKARFDELRKLGVIEFVTFHQNYAYEDFVVGIRPDLGENSSLRFTRSEGVFYKQCVEATKNYRKSAISTGDSVYVSFEEVLEEFLKEFPSRKPQFGSTSKYFVYDFDETRLYFETANGKRESWQRLLTSRLKEYFNGTFIFKGNYHLYYSKINDEFNKIRERLEKQRPPGGIVRQNYVIIIDEINRANISKVFGELITLLEEDKRLGANNELKVTLPNGEREFGVPPNLYLLGTMNTADKSIALIDVALRRRFEFVGYYPKPELLTNTKAADLLKTINTQIFERKKSADYLIGHAYFMGDISIDLVLRNKVIPLLSEYFAGKTDIICEIFSNTAWTVKYDTSSFDWSVSEN